MRSRSVAIFSVAIVSRRSMASGWRLAIIEITRSSMRICSASTVLSVATTFLRQGQIARAECLGGVLDLAADGRAHVDDEGAEFLQFGVEAMRRCGAWDLAIETLPGTSINRSGR